MKFIKYKMRNIKKYTWAARWEMHYPFIYSSLLLICYFIFGNKLSFDFVGLVNISMSLFGILIGFLITVLTIINSIDNKYLRAIKNKEETYQLFKGYLINAILFFFYTLITGLLYIFIFSHCEFPIKDLSESVVLYITSYSLISCYRFIRAFIGIAI